MLEHGYCRSLYVRDPNGLLVELTADHPDVEAINATRACRHTPTWRLARR